jgi:iron-sulfur cluster repair protein YtfE (RIC family)
MMYSKAAITLSVLACSVQAFIPAACGGSSVATSRGAVFRQRAALTDATKNGDDILNVLSKEHQEAIDMLKKMESSSNPEEMRILNDKVIILLTQHSIVEETLVYPLIAEKVDKAAVEKDKKEHHRLEELMLDLERANPTQPNFNEAVKALREELEHHRTKEEREQFKQLRDQVPKEQLRDIVGKAQSLKEFAPTHPHPFTHASHSPAFDSTVGAAVGLADRVRDAVTGRTTDELSEVSIEGPGKDN